MTRNNLTRLLVILGVGLAVGLIVHSWAGDAPQKASAVAPLATPAPTPAPRPLVDKRANQACAELRQLGRDMNAGDVIGAQIVERTDYIGQIGKRVDETIAPAVAKAADNLASNGRRYSVGAPLSYVETSLDRMTGACDAYDRAKTETTTNKGTDR